MIDGLADEAGVHCAGNEKQEQELLLSGEDLE
jgi:hypothetical protein